MIAFHRILYDTTDSDPTVWCHIVSELKMLSNSQKKSSPFLKVIIMYLQTSFKYEKFIIMLSLKICTMLFETLKGSCNAVDCQSALYYCPDVSDMTWNLKKKYTEAILFSGFHCCRYEGVLGFYKGLSANLIRVTPATMITFLVYENVSHFLLNLRSQGLDSDTTLQCRKWWWKHKSEVWILFQ
jgi:hypothetical protein